jgi:ABC-type uncharacterized transport system ATPase subunit
MAAHRKLAADFGHQAEAVVEDVLSAHDRILGIQGFAGAGKTTALATLRNAVEGQDYEVQGFAPTYDALLQR